MREKSQEKLGHGEYLAVLKYAVKAVAFTSHMYVRYSAGQKNTKHVFVANLSGSPSKVEAKTLMSLKKKKKQHCFAVSSRT